MDEFEGLNLQGVNIEELAVASDVLPSLPQTENEYNEDVYYNVSSENRTAEYTVNETGEVKNFDDGIDWGSLAPVDKDGFRNDQEIDFDSLTPYNVTEKPATVWDELALKKDMGSFTQYRAQVARDVMLGKITLEEGDMITFQPRTPHSQCLRNGSRFSGRQRPPETNDDSGLYRTPHHKPAFLPCCPFLCQ